MCFLSIHINTAYAIFLYFFNIKLKLPTLTKDNSKNLIFKLYMMNDSY